MIAFNIDVVQYAKSPQNLWMWRLDGKESISGLCMNMYRVTL